MHLDDVIRAIEAKYQDKTLPEMNIGDTLRVHTRIKEGDRERVQVFEGILIRWRKGGVRSTITVRKVSHNVGVERIFPIYGPAIEKVEVRSRARVRRARLYYLRNLAGKASRLKELDRSGTKKRG
jgi:large subunit ribosomal protein L19